MCYISIEDESVVYSVFYTSFVTFDISFNEFQSIVSFCTDILNMFLLKLFLMVIPRHFAFFVVLSSISWSWNGQKEWLLLFSDSYYLAFIRIEFHRTKLVNYLNGNLQQQSALDFWGMIVSKGWLNCRLQVWKVYATKIMVIYIKSPRKNP